MWQSIKKFFKRIADCTGISWIARKISSGWNSVKNWWFGNKVSNTNSPKTPEKPSDIPVPSITNEPNPAEPEPVASIVEDTDKGELVLFVESNNISKILGGGLGIANNVSLSSDNIMDKLKCSAYIKCEKGIFKITCDKLIEANSKGAFLSIESIASQDGKDSSSELEGMKNMLGFSSNNAIIRITQISKNPIKVPKTVEGNTPNSETTSPEAQPHTADGHAM